MRDSGYTRKMDTSGRLVVPSQLRDRMQLRSGDEHIFYIHEEDGRTFLCIECTRLENEIDRAKRILREAGVESLDE